MANSQFSKDESFFNFPIFSGARLLVGLWRKTLLSALCIFVLLSSASLLIDNKQWMKFEVVSSEILPVTKGRIVTALHNRILFNSYVDRAGIAKDPKLLSDLTAMFQEDHFHFRYTNSSSGTSSEKSPLSITYFGLVGNIDSRAANEFINFTQWATINAMLQEWMDKQISELRLLERGVFLMRRKTTLALSLNDAIRAPEVSEGARSLAKVVENSDLSLLTSQRILNIINRDWLPEVSTPTASGQESWSQHLAIRLRFYDQLSENLASLLKCYQDSYARLFSNDEHVTSPNASSMLPGANEQACASSLISTQRDKLSKNVHLENMIEPLPFIPMSARFVLSLVVAIPLGFLFSFATNCFQKKRL